MANKYIKRLQGREFAEELPKLTLVAYLESLNGNICGYYAYEGRKVLNVLHWMNDEEQAEFRKNKPDIYKLSNQKEANRVRILRDGVTLLPEKEQRQNKSLDYLYTDNALHGKDLDRLFEH